MTAKISVIRGMPVKAIKASSPLFLGAEVNLNIDGIDLRQALIKTFGPEILNFQPSDLEDAIKVIKFPGS